MKQLVGALVLVNVFSSVAMNAHAESPWNDSTWNDAPLNARNPASTVNTLPLLSISLGASAQTINSYSLDVTAVVNTWSVNSRYEPTFTSHRMDFAVQPGQKDAMVMKSLELKESASPQSLLDKMLIDGALTLNMTW